MFNVIKNGIALGIACALIALADYATAGSLLFVNGSTTTILNCGSATILDNLGAESRVVIFRASNLDPAATRAMLHGGGGGCAQALTITSASTGSLDYSRGFSVTTGTANATWANFVSIGTNEWICAASTFDGTNAPKLYAGEVGARILEPAAYTTQTAPSGTACDDSANDEKIGGISGSAFGFPGNIAFAGIWNRALSQEEVQAICNSPHKVSGGSNVLFTYPGFTGGATEPDFSGYNHTCTRTAATLDIGAPVKMKF